jgi:hypothetical protein
MMYVAKLPDGLLVDAVARWVWEYVHDGIDPEDSMDDLTGMLAKKFNLSVADAKHIDDRVFAGVDAAFGRSAPPDKETDPSARATFDLVAPELTKNT